MSPPQYTAQCAEYCIVNVENSSSTTWCRFTRKTDPPWQHDGLVRCFLTHVCLRAKVSTKNLHCSGGCATVGPLTTWTTTLPWARLTQWYVQVTWKACYRPAGGWVCQWSPRNVKDQRRQLCSWVSSLIQGRWWCACRRLNSSGPRGWS